MSLENKRSQSAPPARPQRAIKTLEANMRKRYPHYRPLSNLNKFFRQATWLSDSKAYVQANDTTGWMEIESFMEMMKNMGNKIHIHKWKDTKKLELYARNIGISNDQLGELGMILRKRFPTLQSLTLDFGWGLEISDNGLINLIEGFSPYLTKLTRLSLSFPECKGITDKGIGFLATKLSKHMFNLNSLALNFSKCPRISQKGFKELSSAITRKLFKLEHLELNFSHVVKIEEKGLCTLGTYFGHSYLKNLKSLSLGFSGCHAITEESVENFAKNLQDGFTNLRKMDLDFSDCSMLGDKSLKAISLLAVNQCKDLRELELGLSTQKITNEGLVFFGRKMQTISDRITLLRMDLSDNRHLAILCKKETKKFLKAIPTVIIR